MATIFEQTLREITETLPQTPERNTTTNSVDEIDSQIESIVKDRLAGKYNEVLPSTEEVENATEGVDLSRKLSFGFAESMSGTSGAAVRPWVISGYKYLIANDPEMATRMGLHKPGQKEDPTESSVMNAVLNYSKAAQTSFVNSLVRLFGSEEQVKEWDIKQQEEAFGKEWFEMNPEQRRQWIDQEAEAQLKKDFPEFYDNPQLRESGWVTAGNIGAALISPETLIAPAAQSYKTAAAIGAGWGASDMALLDLADRGKIDPMHVAGGATFGAIFAPVLKAGLEKGVPYVGKKTGQVFDYTALRLRSIQANSTLDKYERIIAEQVKGGVSKGHAIMTAKGALGMDAKSINHMYTITGRERKIPKSVEQAADFVTDIEDRMSWWRTNSAINEASKTLSKWTVPIIDRVAKMAPKVAHELRGVDFRTHLRTHSYFLRTEDWVSKFKKLNKADRKQIKKLLSVDSKDAFREAGLIMRKIEDTDPTNFKGFVNDWIHVRKLMSEISQEYKGKGYKFDPLEHFFPRVAKYPKHMTKAHVGLFHKLTTEAAEKKGSALSHDELGILMRNTFSRIKREGGKVHSSGHLRGRTVDEISDFLEPYYADPVEALHSYLRMASNDIERMSFFQKFGITQKEARHIDLIDKSIPDDIGKLAKNVKGLNHSQQEELVEMLNSRFTMGESSPHRFWQTFKNIGYTVTLFNPYSALTQFGDQAFSFYKYGIKNTLKTWVTPKVLDKSDLGLTDAMAELYANTTMTKRTMDAFAKWSGFTSIDKFGKDVILNSALTKYTKLAKTREGAHSIAKEWGRYFEEDTPRLIRDLYDGKLTDNVKLLLWHDLADVQPIALSEMPQKYLSMPNGRVFYMLKSFLIKQLSFVRRQIVGELQQNNTTKGLTNLAMFAGYWNLVGGAVDMGKSKLVDMFADTSTPIDISDLMVENTIQMIGLNKYHTRRAGQVGPVATAVDFLMPPIPIIDDVAIAAYQNRPEKAWKAIPYLGPVANKMAKAKKKQKERLSKYDYSMDRELSPREKQARRRLTEFDYGL